MATDATPDDRRRDRALALLAAGQPIGVVAKAIGVNRTTLHRWRNGATPGATPTPLAVLEVAAAKVIDARVDTLTEAARVQRAIAADLHRNLEVLQEIRDNPDADTSARVRAAMTLLDRGGVPVGSEVRVEVAHSPTPAELAVELLALPGPVADNREAVSK